MAAQDKETIKTISPIVDVEASDFDTTKRTFIKVLLSTGLGSLLVLLFSKKSEALTFGQSGYIEPTYTTKIDEASSTVTYMGKAAIGSSTASAIWQIKKISESGDITSIEWAAGADSFDQIWDNRASLSYS